MPDSQASSCTIEEDVPAEKTHRNSGLDLSGLPPTFILSTHLSSDELHKAEDDLSACGAPLTYDMKEANLVLGNILKERRAKLELQWGGARTEDIKQEPREMEGGRSIKDERDGPAKKRRKVNGHQSSLDMQLGLGRSSPAGSTKENEDDCGAKPMSQLSISQVASSPTVYSSEKDGTEDSMLPAIHTGSFEGWVKVVKLEWLRESLNANTIQSLEPYIIYQGKLSTPNEASPTLRKFSAPMPVPKSYNTLDEEDGSEPRHGKAIPERANAEARPGRPRNQRRDRIKDTIKSEFAGRSFIGGSRQSQSFAKPSKLLHQTTSQHDEGQSTTFPPTPDWVLQNKIYSCERSTPLHPPNTAFIAQLRKIKFARVLIGDEIGVRAYSTSIASLAAYPNTLTSTNEILALSGCDHKIAHLFQEWQSSGHIEAVIEIGTEPILSVLSTFHDIWGVGAITAREFYYDHGWRDLDDIIERGWKTLSRVQQIGVKYYDEFLLPIPCAEVEAIASIIHSHGKRVTDANLECIIVGGYRRGKPESGDVDLILSHRDEAQTSNLVERVVRSLETSGEITHTLTINLTNTKRDQQPLPLAPVGGGHGFDTLDKALVVWQFQDWPTRDADLAANPKAKNPNPHRRVDIIISPWRTIGCAVQGWTSGTTFERDLRRYAKKVKGWKFDSSGVRERGTGRWVDLERWGDERTRAGTWQEAERRVFEGLGLPWREPEERCTD